MRLWNGQNVKKPTISVLLIELHCPIGTYGALEMRQRAILQPDAPASASTMRFPNEPFGAGSAASRIAVSHSASAAVGPIHAQATGGPLDTTSFSPSPTVCAI